MKPRIKRHEVIQPLDKPYRFIPLTRNQNAVVDKEDFDYLARFNWTAAWRQSKSGFYASTRINRMVVYMHRLILGCGKGEEGDHISGEGLDNRRANLRKCSLSENRQNPRKRRDNTSGFKGVHYRPDKKVKRWCAEFISRKTRFRLGYFLTAEEAARAYDAKAQAVNGEFAHLNFPPMANENRNP